MNSKHTESLQNHRSSALGVQYCPLCNQVYSLKKKKKDYLSSKRNNNVTIAFTERRSFRHSKMLDNDCFASFFSLWLQAADYLIIVYTATWSEFPDFPLSYNTLAVRLVKCVYLLIQ